MATRRSAGVERVLNKLGAAVSAGNFYEAHQLYRTLYFRYLMQEKYKELLDLLYSGSKLLLQNEQLTSGADLCNLYVDVLGKSSEPVSDDVMKKLSELIGLIGPGVPERENFLSNALRWSVKGSPDFKTGHPQLHRFIAQIFWREKNYVLARYHFLHSTDGSSFAMMLVEIHTRQGYPSEVDLFITQVVLQYLCLHNKTTAADAFRCYTLKHPDIKPGPPFLEPLLNFIWFLLKAIESGKLPVFTLLCKKYKPSLDRDPTYTSYLNKIAQIFFGLAPQRPRNQGFLGNLMQLLNDPHSSDSDEDEHPPKTSSGQNRSNQKMEAEELD
ncbi:Golgi to ER traffic protein 4 homolog [Thrips palmi]|uniref:Golgi to ER traffic protein 4 homolog n=1 Tax=Thrips palmi TaxID=161013 RepID=A0A6P8ZV11_THRPL|nr:Golgi to ER traffic protein 4 homolog [Thrips palmi]